MLRDDRQVFLNDLIVANRETVAAYEQALTHIDEGDAGETCRAQLASCRDIVARLEADLRSLGDLPGQPDEERELLRAAGRQALSALSPRPDWEVLVDALIEHERKTADLCEGAGALDLPDAVAKTVAQCRDRAQAAIKALGETEG